jgi:hypothetical protein
MWHQNIEQLSAKIISQREWRKRNARRYESESWAKASANGENNGNGSNGEKRKCQWRRNKMKENNGDERRAYGGCSASA